MAYEEKDNSFSLFKNERKRPDKTDPDYTGKGMINGKPVWVSGWIKKSPAMTYLSCGVTPRQKTATPNAQQATQDNPEEMF